MSDVSHIFTSFAFNSSGILSVEMFSRNVQVLPGKSEVVSELQPYIENVLRADDPMFWQKLRCDIIFRIEKNFLGRMMSNF